MAEPKYQTEFKLLFPDLNFRVKRNDGTGDYYYTYLDTNYKHAGFVAAMDLCAGNNVVAERLDAVVAKITRDYIEALEAKAERLNGVISLAKKIVHEKDFVDFILACQDSVRDKHGTLILGFHGPLVRQEAIKLAGTFLKVAKGVSDD